SRHTLPACQHGRRWHTPLHHPHRAPSLPPTACTAHTTHLDILKPPPRCLLHRLTHPLLPTHLPYRLSANHNTLDKAHAPHRRRPPWCHIQPRNLPKVHALAESCFDAIARRIGRENRLVDDFHLAAHDKEDLL